MHERLPILEGEGKRSRSVAMRGQLHNLYCWASKQAKSVQEEVDARPLSSWMREHRMYANDFPVAEF